MLRHEAWREPSAASIAAVWQRHKQATLRCVPVGLFTGLLLAGSIVAAQQGFGRPRPAANQPAVSTAPSLYDYAPSDYRRKILDRIEAGKQLPNSGVIELEQENSEQAVELAEQRSVAAQQQQQLSAQQQRIGQLDQQVQADRATLTGIASKLGLPKDQLAPAPPAAPAAAAKPGVGGALGSDTIPASKKAAMAPAAAQPVASAADLEARVADYLNLPCPLPAGDPRCQQAVDHAKAELARGHGLDVNKPDALPTLGFDVAQDFGPTDVDLEPLHMLADGSVVHFHEGVDLAAQYDQPVMAAASGTVVFAGEIPSGALTVEIAHADGLHTLYLHSEQLLVQQGQQVKKGQIIALVGSTGNSTGPHVHFQVNDPSGNPIDPMPFIK